MKQNYRLRTVLAAFFLLILPVLFTVGWLTWSDRLPEILPTHWGPSGDPDGFSDTATFTMIMAAILAISTVLGIVLCLSRRPQASNVRFWLAAVGMVQGLSTSIWFVSAVVTLDSGRVDQAQLGGWIILVIASIAWGGVPSFIYPAGPPAHAHNHTDRAMGVAEPWSETVTAPMLGWIGAMVGVVTPTFAGLAIETGDMVFVIVAVIVAIALIPCLMLVKYRVTITDRGFTVTSSYLGLAMKRIGIKDVDDFSSGELVPAEWGGWGWRVMPGKSAIVTKRGSGLFIRMTNGKEFALSLPGADQAAATLNAYMAEQHSSR